VRAFFAIALGACSFQHGTIGGDGASPAGDDGGLVIDAPVILPDAPDNPADDDDDDDGVLDVADNCPVTANTNQWNEDGDTLGDACDPCPQYMAATADTDSDGIGDLCDPRPASAGDVMVLFEGFNTPGGVPAGWTTSGGGTWAVADGKVTYTPSGNTPAFALYPLPSAGDHTVGSIATTAGVTNVTQVVALVMDATPNLSDFFMCSVSVYETMFRLAHWSGSWAELSSTAANPTPPDTYPIVARAQTTQQRCGIAAQQMGGGVQTPNGTRVGLRSYNVTVSFRYFVVYRSP
jgi:hypothetical protein